ncbi:MAG: hypothetical protein NVS9B15_00340 [Acidobacteriaceae bacterium]
MKWLVIISRVLLGLLFVVSGMNGFLHFIPAPPMSGLPGQFMAALMQSHYIYFICAVQVIGGALLLIGQFVPLGLTLLAPVIANILVYHLTMQLAGIGPGIVTFILWWVVAYAYWPHFAPLLQQKPTFRIP